MKTSAELTGTLRQMAESETRETNVHMPAVVDSVNSDNTVNIHLAITRPIMNLDGSRDYQQSEIIEQVPVILLSSGNFAINVPIKPGTKGLVHFNDYDHDNFHLGNTNGQGISDPHTTRRHAFNDAVFEPAFNGAKIDGDCLTITSKNVVLKICDNGFDVELNGRSLIDDINNGFASCGCGQPLTGWKP